MKKIVLSTVLAASSWVLFAQDTTNRTNTNNTTTNQQMNTSTNQSSNMNTTSNQMYNNSTSNYNAYGIPNYVQMNFETQYPNVSNMTWMPATGDWYHGYYSNGNRYAHMYYSTDPYYNVQYYPERVTGYTVSLPVLQTWVPDEVVTTATNLYKQNLYDITALRRSNSSNMNNMSSSSNSISGNNASPDVIYQVRVLDNGEVKTMWMDANGTAVTDYWRTDMNNTMSTTTDVNNHTSTDTNAAMDNSSNINTNAKVKTKTKMSDGSEIKTKTKNGKTKAKNTGSSSSTPDQL